ncbi:sigma-70 family RNA polymerase sigma factor [Solirubrobacter taibaiensis]|nr:sigma-70 family RNA polymerase sigma factor [Solirubrobacter taibaiensis]
MSVSGLRPLPNALSRETTAQLFERYHRERRPSDRDELVLRHMRLASSLAVRYRANHEHDDLQQVAAIGLVKAVDRFDPSRGLAFSSFAVPTILGELKRYFRDLGWSVRAPREIQELSLRLEREGAQLTGRLGRTPTVDELARACEVTAEAVLEARMATTAHYADSLDHPGPDDDEDVPERLVATEDPGFARAEQNADLDRLLSHLSHREQTVLYLRFGEDLVQREIAVRIGSSQMQVSRMLRQSIATLQTQSSDWPRPVTR